MRVSERWLREWCNPALDTRALADAYTQAGLEVESVEPLAPLPATVVAARVQEVRAHPNADRLRLCTVEAAPKATPVQIVCGAPNVRAGMTVPLARIGTSLPGGLVVKAARIRGETSDGMLCSAAELGLWEDAGGLLELPAAAPGTPLAELLDTHDAVLGFNLTPNRGDCLSVRGLARELSALTGAPLQGPTWAMAAAHARRVPVILALPQACPRYACRVVTDLDPGAATPLWMQARLRRAGLRSLGPLVDVTNYVLLELGQPLHAFDLERIEGGITVRPGSAAEVLALITGDEIAADAGLLLIADARGPLAAAGIMGGAASAVSAGTRHVLLESAYFSPHWIGPAARRLDLITEAALRFERGVDPTLQVEALERATELLLGICGGTPGPVVDVSDPEHLPKPPAVRLRPARVTQVLGAALDPEWSVQALTRLGMGVSADPDGWRVTAPPWRFDLAIEEDLIEELARLHGYALLPAQRPAMRAAMPAAPEGHVPPAALARILVGRGYQEAITYSFVDRDLQARLDPQSRPVALANPLSADLGVLRTSLWPGLVRAALHNLHRQEVRVRLFELGRRFLPDPAGGVREQAVLAGLVIGPRHAEQWGESDRLADFHDLKADVEALTGPAAQWRYVPAAHGALHPGQCARLLRGEVEAGVLGRLHPRHEQHLELPPTYVFELDLEALCTTTVPQYTAVPRLPSVRRDLALVVDMTVPAQAILDTLRTAAGELLREAVLFDVYHGPGVPAGARSLTIGLRLGQAQRTLTDAEVDAVVGEVLAALAARHGARLREQHGTHQG